MFNKNNKDMIRLKSIIELFTIVWKSKTKTYLVITLNYVYEFDTFQHANKKAIELIKQGEVNKVRIALELSVMKSIVEIKK